MQTKNIYIKIKQSALLVLIAFSITAADEPVEQKAEKTAEEIAEEKNTCPESVQIDTMLYQVPELWCGHQIPADLKASPGTHVRLPASVCFQDFKIYVTRETRKALVAMAEEARKENFLLQVDSGYRSSRYQREIFKRRMEEGKTLEEVARFVAPPGYSQHETGRAIDVVPSEAAFEITETYKWLKNNAHKFGFVESYPENNPDSIPWEPYHWYYQGQPDTLPR